MLPTVSIGASLLGEAVSASALIARADEEMYRAKRVRRA
jgi:GGDEF domain-containing protein